MLPTPPQGGCRSNTGFSSYLPPRSPSHDDGSPCGSEKVSDKLSADDEVHRQLDDRLFDFDALDAAESLHSDRHNGDNVLGTSDKQIGDEEVHRKLDDRPFHFDMLDVMESLRGGCQGEKALNVEDEAKAMSPGKPVRPGMGFGTLDALHSATEQSEISTPASEGAICSQAPTSKGRIAILVSGLVGEFLPVATLAEELLQRGYEVQILTNINYVKACRERGIDSRPVFPDVDEVTRSVGSWAGKGLWDSVSKMWNTADAWCNANPDALVDPQVAAAEFKPTLVIGNTFCLSICFRIEAVLQVPIVPVHFASDLLHTTLRFFSRASGRPVIMACMRDMLSSSLIAEHPEIHITPAWVPESGRELVESLPTGRQALQLQALKDFLVQGPKPVAIGWGTMIAKGPMSMLRVALRTLCLTGRRGVIIGGWARLEELGRRLVEGRLTKAEARSLGSDMRSAYLPAFAKKNVFFISQVPHSWLLPQCSCFINHGGVGTVQSSLRAGCPVVVTPIGWQEYSLAAFVQRHGFGRGFDVSLTDLNEEMLALSIKYAETCHEEVAKASARMREEEERYRGVARGADIVENLLTEVVQCGASAKQLKAVETKAAQLNAD